MRAQCGLWCAGALLTALQRALTEGERRVLEAVLRMEVEKGVETCMPQRERGICLFPRNETGSRGRVRGGSRGGLARIRFPVGQHAACASSYLSVVFSHGRR